MGKLFLCAILTCLVSSAFADDPIAPPSKVTVCSPSGAYCATSDPGTQETTLSRRGLPSPLWKIPGSYAWILVADDGRRMIIGYPGLNLIPKEAAMDSEVFRIYGPTGLVKSIVLRDIYQSKSQLTETISHYEWEKGAYLDVKGHLVVEREDGRKVAFDPSTGNCI